MQTPSLPAEHVRFQRRNSVTLKLLFIASLVALAAVMYCTRQVDWYAHEVASAGNGEAGR